MSQAQISVFDKSRQFSSLVVLGVAALSLLLYRTMDSASMTWQIVVALVALAIGIPHGALDHLVSLPKSSALKMAVFIVLYVAIALFAIWAILKWSVIGFIGVVVMSALHFGIGDTAFISEQNKSRGETTAPPLAKIFYALAGGLLPVAIPLTNSKSVDALAQVNADLINWHGGWDWLINLSVVLITLIAIVFLLSYRRNRDAIDLILLYLLVMIAPPLVAFATYFGMWHAVRHTARLTLRLTSSQKFIAQGDACGAFARAVIPGTPALVGTFIVAAIIGLQSEEKLSDTFLWYSLVVVWALTVPHMLVTARLDRAALSSPHKGVSV